MTDLRPRTAAAASLAPYDGVLLLSFGGPERPDEVMPFLRTVVHGRGVPDERLAGVAEHYHRFGGRSPINDQNRVLLAALAAELSARGVSVPLYWGNRNWHPLLADTLRQAYDAGTRRLLTLVTSAYSSYSGCRQYREDLATALATLAAQGRQLVVDKVRPYFNDPGFVAPLVDAVVAGLAGLPDGAHVVFVTHSLPLSVALSSGPPRAGPGGAAGGAQAGGVYVRQHQDVAAAVISRVAAALGRTPPTGLAYCSRSGPPGQPWLEPDVNDHLRALASAQVPGVLVVPIGFVSDHMEVAYDLDVEARATAESLGLPFARAATVGTDQRFVQGLVDLLLERAARARGDRAASGGPPARGTVGGLGPAADICPRGCCPNPRGARPAACGAGDERPDVPSIDKEG